MTMTAAMLDAIAALARRCEEREARAPDAFSQDSFDDVTRSGLLLAPLEESMGGQSWTLAQSVDAIETLARHSPSFALLASMPLGLAGVVASIAPVTPAPHAAGWAEQAGAFAASVRAGHWYAAANSEKGAGGSLDALKTVAARDADGTWRVTGEKILASSGRYATYFFSLAKVDAADLPGAGIAEMFFLRTDAPGVDILHDWDGFGMRPTESHTVRYDGASAERLFAFPGFLGIVQPLPYWFCLFAAIPLGAAWSLLDALATPAPSSPALRLRLSEALMRYEALRAYLMETAAAWRAGAGPEYAARVLRTKTYVTQESTKLCAELFALSGGRHYRREGRLARALADSFAGTALRPPLPLALDTLVDNFALP